MENRQSPSNKKFISIHEEKLIREVDYVSIAGGSARLPQKQLLDLEILTKSPSQKQTSRVLVSIKPNNQRGPAIKTIFNAEKNRFHSKKDTERPGSHLAIGDHSSFTTHFSENDSNTVNSIASGTERARIKRERERISSVTVQIDNSAIPSKCLQIDQAPRRANVYNEERRLAEKCYIYTQPQINMNLTKLDANNKKVSRDKVNIATLMVTNTSSEDSQLPSAKAINKLNKRIDRLERKILRQEMVFRSIDPNIPLSSSDEESKENMRSTSRTARPGPSFIEQYSHVPETSAFQRYAQQAAPLSPSKATTLEKEHNSEQYGRDFTAYDGITARGRRQCASVPCKRDDVPKLAAERVHKIRHKLNPVRDYRLMDTVHYLAQGEFAPRDDGIKLTPSREGVLSDIIWEDVCRTHWPNTRLGRRAHPERCTERCTTRCELQRLIDSLLRERVAHVERRRRRHYRIVKLNHRHESCRPLGKTGDIIVASHKNRQSDDVVIADQKAGSSMTADKRRNDQSQRKSHRSHDQLMESQIRQRRRSTHEDCRPGTSYSARSRSNREPTCCYHTSNTTRPETSIGAKERNHCDGNQLSSGSSASACKPKNPRLVVKKDTSHRKYTSKEEPNLEHYILLPTLVVRTPSNMKRQKKFSELYHRILNNAQNYPVYTEAVEGSSNSNPNKKDIGFNINITLSNSAEEINRPL